MKLFAFISLLLLIGCKCGHTTSTKKVIVGTPTGQSTSFNDPITNKDRLLGIWTDGSTENATFYIQRDSIFYVDQLTAYKYGLRGDSITINYPDWVFSGGISFPRTL